MPSWWPTVLPSLRRPPTWCFADIDPLPAVSDVTADEPAPIWDDGRNNVLSEIAAVFGEVDAESDCVIIEATFTTGRHTGLPIEPRGIVATVA